MVVTVGDLQETADQLLEALIVYDRFVEGWPYEAGTVPDRVEQYLAEHELDAPGGARSSGVVLATKIKEMYLAVRGVEATYVEQARKRGRSDWDRIVTETEPVREAARTVHAAGYETHSGTGEPGYLLPQEMCPANLVSMNAGSSPVTFEDRIVQYETFADYFDVSPDVVYHPGSGHDVSPSEAFPETRVRYVDVDVAAMCELNRAGYGAVSADAASYELDRKADLIIFRNAGIFEEATVETNLRADGWVLANDHLESATHLASMDALELVGVIPDSWTGTAPRVETRDRDTRRFPNETKQATENRRPGPMFETGSPLDLYVFTTNS